MSVYVWRVFSAANIHGARTNGMGKFTSHATSTHLPQAFAFYKKRVIYAGMQVIFALFGAYGGWLKACFLPKNMAPIGCA